MVPVECTFQGDGRVQVRRVRVDATWHMVEQGRQWVDREGRHVLVRLPGERVQTLLLRRDTITWELRPAGGHNVRIV